MFVGVGVFGVPTGANNAASGRYVDGLVPEAQRTYGLFTHLAGLLSLLDLTLAGPIATLIMWRIKANESEYLDDHGREAMNFQISLVLYSLAAVPIGIITFGLGVPVVLFAVWVLRLVGCIRGAMAANRGEYYRYPMCMRFIKEGDA